MIAAFSSVMPVEKTPAPSRRRITFKPLFLNEFKVFA
jgi:hypothetical protein